MAAPFGDHGRQHREADDPSPHGVFQVVGGVGAAVGPAHHRPFRGGRRRPGPGVVADTVERLGAEVERLEDDVGPPDGVVVATVEVGAERLLAGVPAGAVPAVVAEGDGLGEGHVEPSGPGHGRGDLGDLEGVGEPGALVVVGEDEDLRLPGQAAEGAGVEDPVAVALEGGAERVGLLWSGPVPGAGRPRRPGHQQDALGRLALRPGQRLHRPGGDAGADVGQPDVEPGPGGAGVPPDIRVAFHGGGPPPRPFTLDHVLRVPAGCDSHGGSAKDPGEPVRGWGLGELDPGSRVEHKARPHRT